MAEIVCPEFVDALDTNNCLENYAGLGSDIYVGVKGDLATPMTMTDGTYSTPTFKSGKGLYKVQCADDKEQIKGSSLGYKKGFELTCNFAYDAVNAFSQKLSRAFNNNKIFIIAIDGDKSQIMYDPNRNVKFDNGGIASDTGAAAADDRQTTYECKLSPVLYDHLYVTAPVGGWDSLLASAQTSDDDEGE